MFRAACRQTGNYHGSASVRPLSPGKRADQPSRSWYELLRLADFAGVDHEGATEPWNRFPTTLGMLPCVLVSVSKHTILAANKLRPLILASAFVFVLGACRRQDAAYRTDALIVCPGAEAVTWGKFRGTDQLAYRMKVEYP